MNISRPAGVLHLLFGSVRIGVLQVVQDSRVEQHCVLRHNSNIPADAVGLQVLQVVAINSDGTLGDIVEAIY